LLAETNGIDVGDRKSEIEQQLTPEQLSEARNRASQFNSANGSRQIH
jgi:hypothetical protein